jgi:hypothetical protein
MANLRNRFQCRIIVQDIWEDLDLGEPHTENMYTHSDDDLAKMGIQ